MQTKPRLVETSSKRLTIAILLLVSLNASYSIAFAQENTPATHDVPYRPNAETQYERERCKIDFYLPPVGADQPFPTLVWFHGGALRAGEKDNDDAVRLAKRLNEAGIAVASANYRLHPRVEFPAYVDDAAAAVAFVQRTIADRGGAADKVFVSGHSAGGYLTAMVGVDHRYLDKYDCRLSDIAGFLPVSGQMVTHSTVRSERGIPDTRPIIDEAAPAYFVSADLPPFLAIAGGDDLPARAEENRYFVAAMKAAGHEDVKLLEVPGRNHGTIINRVDEPNEVVAEAMIEFIRRLSE